jgi:hypothetical protein
MARSALIPALCLVLSLGGASALAGEDSCTPRLSFSSKEALRYRCTQVRKLEAEGLERLKTITQEFTLRTLADPGKDGTQELEFQMLRVQIQVKEGDRETNKDSKAGTFPEAKPLLEPIRFRLDARGRILNIRSYAGLDMADAPESAEGSRAQAERVATLLLSTVWLGGLSDFPEKPLKVGDKWIARLGQVSAAGGLQIENKLSAIREGRAIFAQNWVMPDADPSMEQEGKGEAVFDLARGRVVSAKLQNRVETKGVVKINSTTEVEFLGVLPRTAKDPAQEE